MILKKVKIIQNKTLNKDFFKLLKNINGKSYKIANSVTFIARAI